MTLNAWLSGINVFGGLEKIAKHINIIRPDIIALQEVELSRLEALISLLTPGRWERCNDTMGAPNAPYILTRFPVVKHYRPLQNVRTVACALALDAKQPDLLLNVWNVHLIGTPYGPHEACFNDYVKGYWELREVEEDFRREFSPKRVNAMRTLVRDDQFWENVIDADTGATADQPLLLMGSFNTPSHLDWIPATRSLHCNRVFAWPTTELIRDAGLTDSYREVNPDPLEHPGYTWSPVVTYNVQFNQSEPHDRIDYIFYKGNRMQAVASRVYQGNQHLNHSPNHATNDWPSDHASVVTDFDVYKA